MMNQQGTFRIENSAQHGYFRITDTRNAQVVRDSLLWADALHAVRTLEYTIPVFVTRREDGHGDD